MRIYRLFSLLIIIAQVEGCVSSRMVKEATVGDPAVLAFQVVFEDMPGPMIMWLSDDGMWAPPPVVTALSLDPPLPDCKSVMIYANPEGIDSKSLDLKPIDVQPVNLKSSAEEMAQWKNLEQKTCAIILTIGSIEEDGFTGVSASTYTGVFRRYPFSFPQGSSAEPSHLAALPFTLFLDAMLITGLVIYAPIYAIIPDSWPQDALHISFAFPDGTRKETIVTRPECEDLLKLSRKIYTHSAFSSFGAEACNEANIADWTRAALFKLRLSFTEETIADGNRQLSSVGGYEGSWAHDLSCSYRVAKVDICNSFSLYGKFVQDEDEINWSMTIEPNE